MKKPSYRLIYIVNERNTYDVVFGDVEGVEGGGEAAAPLVSLAPRETNAPVDYGEAVGVNSGGPLQECEGR